jgi:hypothetical protein
MEPIKPAEPRDPRAVPVVYGRCLLCSANWSEGVYAVDSCSLCNEMWVAARFREQQSTFLHGIGVRVSRPVEALKSASKWLNPKLLVKLLGTLQVVVYSVLLFSLGFALCKALNP